jgi:hypothetical protein
MSVNKTKLLFSISFIILAISLSERPGFSNLAKLPAILAISFLNLGLASHILFTSLLASSFLDKISLPFKTCVL